MGAKNRGLRGRLGSHRSRNAEINDMGAISCQEDVSRRYVTMDDSFAMEIRNCLAYFAYRAHGIGSR